MRTLFVVDTEDGTPLFHVSLQDKNQYYKHTYTHLYIYVNKIKYWMGQIVGLSFNQWVGLNANAGSSHVHHTHSEGTMHFPSISLELFGSRERKDGSIFDI